MKKVAIERDLSAIGDHLAENGLQVDRLDMTDMTLERLQNYGALIISGQSTNFMGMEDIKANIPVIEARGRSAEQITSMVKNYLELQ